MRRSEERYRTAKWRTLWLLLGFAVLVGIGVVTVVVPELEDEAVQDAATQRGEVGRSENQQDLQE